MASFSVKGVDGLATRIHALGEKSGEVAAAMVAAGAEEAVAAWREAGAHHIRTGAMLDSVKAGKVKKSDEGAYVDVAPTGKDSRGVSNAQKAFVLHYGSSRIKGDHWVDNATKLAEEKAIPAMQRVFDEMTKGD